MHGHYAKNLFLGEQFKSKNSKARRDALGSLIGQGLSAMDWVYSTI